MREIKFRGKSAENLEWVVGGYFCDEMGQHFIVPYGGERVIIIPDSIGQYTGLKDREGKEIYESDLVIWDGGIYEVIFRNGKWVLYTIDDPEYDRPSLYGISSPRQSRIEVIGNIYDNPELLEAKNGN